MAILTRAIVCVVIMIGADAIAKKGDGGVRVRIVRLEGVPDKYAGHRLSVRVSIGNKHLYTTPGLPAERAEWNSRLRVWTRVSNPIRFEVVTTRAKEMSHEVTGPHDDSVLEGTFSEFVSDYDEEVRNEQPSKDNRRPETNTVCKAQLEWLPDDGEHRLACNGAVLVVKTTALSR